MGIDRPRGAGTISGPAGGLRGASGLLRIIAGRSGMYVGVRGSRGVVFREVVGGIEECTFDREAT